MRHGRNSIRIKKMPPKRVQRPEMQIEPINRNFSNDETVVEKISVHSVHKPKMGLMHQLGQKLTHLQTEDIILIGIILLIFFGRHEDDADDNCDDQTLSSSQGSAFSLDKLKQLLPIDQLSDNDILLLMMAYLLL